LLLGVVRKHSSLGFTYEKLFNIYGYICSIKKEYQKYLDSNQFSVIYEKCLQNVNIRISKDAKVKVEEEGKRWLVENPSDDRKYTILKKSDGLHFYRYQELPPPSEEIYKGKWGLPDSQYHGECVDILPLSSREENLGEAAEFTVPGPIIEYVFNTKEEEGRDVALILMARRKPKVNVF